MTGMEILAACVILVMIAAPLLILEWATLSDKQNWPAA
jgi:hypothetical protein